ncbi:interleukin-4 [Trichechus inunguis]|uniref:Interleukin-4 n=1 Tax=Trichechus manatus latirostris TaxID=127582 RepID=A0A2Y9E0J2_TRIMA|nr:interleukin-4 [Trichechus manatus latirostris]
MGLTFQLIPTLLCLLVCTSNFVHGQKCGITLREIIKTLNFLTEKKHGCTELTVADAFAASKNTTEKETICRATTVLWQVYTRHKCFSKYLRGLRRSLSSMTNLTYCPVSEDRTSTLKDFLERLKTIMKEKYSKCGRRIF